MSVAANKIPGIRAGLCHDTYSAHQGVEHDHMNVLVLGAPRHRPVLAEELVGAFLRLALAPSATRAATPRDPALEDDPPRPPGGGNHG